MAKKKGILDELMGALGEGGSDILGDVIEELLGDTTAVNGSDLAEGLLENGDTLLSGLGDIVEDLTGLGATNTKASETAQLSGKTKSSSSVKKKVKTASSVKEKAETAKERAKEKAKTSKSSSSKKKVIR